MTRDLTQQQAKYMPPADLASRPVYLQSWGLTTMGVRWLLLALLLDFVSSNSPSLFGEITSPNYPQGYSNYANQSWDVQVPDGYGIRLYFIHLDIEPSDGCEYDSLQVIIGGEVQERLCGRGSADSGKPMKERYYPSTKLKLLFISDFSNQERYTGFSAYYIAVDVDECKENSLNPCSHFCNNYIGGFFCSCPLEYDLQENQHTCGVNCSGGMYTELRGLISSPGYPSPYPENLHCEYKVLLEPGYQVIITFLPTDFDIKVADNGSCYDSLTINAKGRSFGPFCGKWPPPHIETQSNEVDIIFQTDSGGDNKGWKMLYSEEPILCTTVITDHSILDPWQEKYTFKDTVTIRCKEGYGIQLGDKTQTTFWCKCQEDGKWSNSHMKCQPIDCGNPEGIDAGEVMFNTTTYKSEAKYICSNEYYTLSEEGTYHCSLDGQWVNQKGQKDLPKCNPAIICPSVITEHSILDPLLYTYKFNDTVTVRCEEGYEILMGDKSQLSFQSKCQRDGTWSSSHLKCQPVDCGNPEGMNDGKVMFNTTTYKSEAKYICNNEYYKTSEEGTYRCSLDRLWVNSKGQKDLPKCKPAILCPSVITEHSILDSLQDKYTFSDTVTVRCEEGYEILLGNKRLLSFWNKCQEDGKWSNSHLKCQPVDCGNPEDIDAGKVMFNTTTYQSEAKYICSNKYYTLSEDGIYHCSLDGHWVNSKGQKDLPKCILGPAVDCGDPEGIDDGHVLFDTTTYKSEAKYICSNEYYTLSEEGTYRCSLDRHWVNSKGQKDLPKCNPVCGKSKLLSTSRIYGGAEAQNGYFPWVVIIHGPTLGVGALISDRWVLTAAHVVEDNPEPRIRAGDVKISNTKRLQGKMVFLHPAWEKDNEEERTNYDNDIALILLDSKVIMGPCICPVCLPEEGEKTTPALEELGYVAGWGKTSDTDEKIRTRVLQYVPIPIRENKNCKESLETNRVFTENMMCAGGFGKDTCTGDDGGPLMFQDLSAKEEDKRLYVGGIVSWGVKCGEFGMFTKVKNYLDWIKETIRRVEEEERGQKIETVNLCQKKKGV